MSHECRLLVACSVAVFFVIEPGLLEAQTAISADGVIESTSGGFKFPDGSVQTTAGGPGRAPVAATGQQLCYDPSGATTDTIDCAAAAGKGQDGAVRAGVPWPVPRFTDNLDGTVTDNLTALVWMKDTNCADFDTLTGFEESLSAANTLASGVCGLIDSSVAGDWRIPNVRELLSVLDLNHGVEDASLPLPPGHPFVNDEGIQASWTSTSVEGNADSLWQFSQTILSNAGKGNSQERFWAVRGGGVATAVPVGSRPEFESAAPSATAVSADGVIESSTGGFLYPDGTVQTTASTSAPAPVADTGQRRCFDPSGTTSNEIECWNTGQDGALQSGLDWPAPRFTGNGDGTVTDEMTGLVWLQDAYCEEFTQYVTFAEALTTANGLASGDCGLSDGSVAGDWRLPNIRELLSLAGYGHVSSIPNRILPPGHPFLNVNSEEYWSSTTFVVDPTGAYTWFLDDAGFSFLAKNDTAAIWPVRGPE